MSASEHLSPEQFGITAQDHVSFLSAGFHEASRLHRRETGREEPTHVCAFCEKEVHAPEGFCPGCGSGADLEDL